MSKKEENKEINFSERYNDTKNKILESMRDEVYSGKFKTNDILNSLCYTLGICITNADKDVVNRRHLVKECCRVISTYVEDDSLR